MKTRQFTLIALAIGILAIVAFFIFSTLPQKPPETNIPPVQTKIPVTDFSGCIATGNSIMESYPRKCINDGETFTEDISGVTGKPGLIRLDSPHPGELITSPLTIRGEARGNWFFEASFPVVLTNWDGLIIAQGIATAQGDWMTKEFVPFEAVLKFDVQQSYSNRGSLILKKDNPSGLPENDDALKVPVLIGISGTGTMSDETLRQLFIEKYPKYSETLTVRIDKETSDYARGGVIFETGAPGGIFLATKIDGKWQIVFDGNGQISCDLSKYGFPTDMLSDCTQTEGVQADTGSTSYQNLIDYISSNITEIIGAYSAKKATNGKWFADGFGFTSARHVYVDFEDGHFLFRTLLECDSRDSIITCTPLAILEQQEREWIATEGTDSQKDYPIIHTWAKDYEWQR